MKTPFPGAPGTGKPRGGRRTEVPAVGRARGWPRKGQGRVSWGRESWDQTVVTAPSSPACPEPRTAHSKMANVMRVDSISVFKNIRARVSTHGVGGLTALRAVRGGPGSGLVPGERYSCFSWAQGPLGPPSPQPRVPTQRPRQRIRDTGWPHGPLPAGPSGPRGECHRAWRGLSLCPLAWH